MNAENHARVRRFAEFVRWSEKQNIHLLGAQDDFAWMLFSALDDHAGLADFLRGRATGASFVFEKIVEFMRYELAERTRLLPDIESIAGRSPC